jgi:predicted dehydrogenase
MVQASRKHNRLVFAGTQQLSAPHFAELTSIVQGGGIGKVHLVRVWNFSNMLPNGIGRAPDSDPPNGLDWELYLGPAPKVAYNPKRFKSTFRWFWDYAGGTITDFGTHRFDTVHQIMGSDRPVSVSATGDATSLHTKRFIETVRNLTTFNADVEVGHRATAVALLGNIAMKSGEKLKWDAEKETTDSAAANRLLRRQARKPWDLPA